MTLSLPHQDYILRPVLAALQDLFIFLKEYCLLYSVLEL